MSLRSKKLGLKNGAFGVKIPDVLQLLLMLLASRITMDMCGWRAVKGEATARGHVSLAHLSQSSGRWQEVSGGTTVSQELGPQASSSGPLVIVCVIWRRLTPCFLNPDYNLNIQLTCRNTSFRNSSSSLADPALCFKDGWLLLPS